MSVRLRFVFAVCSFLLVFSGAAVAAQSGDGWSKAYTITGKPDLRIETNDGHIRVDTWDRNEVSAHVLVRGWSVGVGSGDVRISERQDGNTITLDVRAPRSVWSFNLQSRSIEIELSVPRQANLVARSGDGHIQVGDLAGDVNLRTGDGHITLTGVRGPMRVYTGDGRIEGHRLEGPLDAQTGDGSIRVSGLFDQLDLRTGDGHIQAEVESGSKVAAGWSLRTSDGNIRLRVPENIRADLEVHTGDGRVNLDFPVEVLGRLNPANIRGRINGGGPLLRLRSGDGNITLDKTLPAQ